MNKEQSKKILELMERMKQSELGSHEFYDYKELIRQELEEMKYE